MLQIKNKKIHIIRHLMKPMAAKKFIEEKLAMAEYGFSLVNLMAETGLSNIAARNQLLRLRPLVRRISPKLGFYLIVQPEHRRVGSPPVEWWLDDFFRWFGNPYYIALQSAAEWHGSSPQAIQVTQVMTDVPRKEICVWGRRIRFYVKKSIKDTLVAGIAGARCPVRVSVPEATVFDLVRYAPKIGGLDRAMETMLPLLSNLRSDVLKAVLVAEDEVSTSQRLGWVFEKLGFEKLAAVVFDWLPKSLPVVPLVLGSGFGGGGAVIKKWGVRENR
jgi:hypothetical protein